MDREKFIELLLNWFFPESERDNFKQYLLGNIVEFKIKEIEIERDISFYSYSFDFWDENGNFIETENGKIFEKFIGWLYKYFPKVLIEKDRGLEFRYSLYKKLGFTKEFIKEDFKYQDNENRFVLWTSDIEEKFPASWKWHREKLKNLLNFQKEVAEELIEEIELTGNVSVNVGILLIEKILQNKEEKDIKIFEKIFINILNCRYKNELLEVMDEYLKDSPLNDYYKNTMKNSYFIERNKTDEIAFLAHTYQNLHNFSEIINECIKLSFILETNMFFQSKSIKLYKKLGLPKKFEIFMYINEFFKELNVQWYNESFKVMDIYFEEIGKTIKENLTEAKKLLKSLIKKQDIKSSLLLSYLLKENIFTDDEKIKYIKNVENILIDMLEKEFSNKFNYEDFDFLKNKEFLNEKKEIPVLRKLKNSEGISIISMIDYSEIFENCFLFMEKHKVGNFNYLPICYYYTHSDKTKNIYENLYKKGVSLCFMYNKLFYCFYTDTGDYTRNLNKLKYKDEHIKSFRNVVENNENAFWEEYIKLDEKEAYKEFSLISLIENLYGKDSKLDFSKVPIFAENIKIRYFVDFTLPKYLSKIEKILQPKEKEARDEVEKLLKSKPKAVVQMSQRLLKYWDNDRIMKELESISDIEEIIEYISKMSEKIDKKKIPYEDKIDYGNIRIKNSEEKLPSEIVKYYISEYIGLKDIYILGVCKKIEEISNINDLRKLLTDMFDLWIEDNYTVKYKNIIAPFCITAGEKELAQIQEYLNKWMKNKPVMVVLGLEGLSLSSNEKSLLIVEKFLKSKTKKVREGAIQTLNKIAENMGISRDELSDILIPNFGFGRDKTRIFDYGERKIKAVLNTEKEVPEIIFFDNEGNQLKTMPRSAKKYNDNEETVKEYQAEIKNIKKELKNLVEVQKIKLAWAIATEKTWKVEKWKKIFSKNPVMHQFATSLIWAEFIENKNEKNKKIIKTFRYMDDGTFNDVNGDECDISDENAVMLISPADLPENEIAKWKEQLEDYEINQPILQLDLPIFKINNIEETEITEFENNSFTARNLKKVMEKYGFSAKYYEYYSCSGYSYFEERNKIMINIQAEFAAENYNELTKVERIYFEKNQEKLKISDVPKKLVNFVCYLIETMKK